jgi:hypothetical protein
MRRGRGKLNEDIGALLKRQNEQLRAVTVGDKKGFRSEKN